MGTNRSACVTGILLGVLVILLACVIYIFVRARRARRLGPPADCSDYPGVLRDICQGGVDACKTLSAPRDVAACNAAVGACMPAIKAVAEAEGDTPVAAFNRVAPHVTLCAEAVAKISPKGVPDGGISLPPDIYPFFHDPEARRNIQDLARLVPAAVDWGLDFGRTLPRGSFQPGPHVDCYADGTCPGMREQMSKSGSLRPPRIDCYADMACHPDGRCMADFADDPPYGGTCVPA